MNTVQPIWLSVERVGPVEAAMRPGAWSAESSDATKVPPADGVNAYQTVPPEAKLKLQEAGGSKNSVVAARGSTLSLNGTTPTCFALAKLSLAGAAIGVTLN